MVHEAPGADPGGIGIEVLGELTVRRIANGARSTVTDLRPATRRLLVALVVERKRTVNTDELAEIMWPGQPPASWTTSLQSHVSRLRRALTPDAIGSSARGYRCELPDQAIDLCRFEALVRSAGEARSRSAARARELLVEALALWRGRAFEPFADEPFVLPEAQRLESLQLDAAEMLADAELALGLDADALVRLDALVASAPYREHNWAQLMRALYRQGRGADALACYQRARALFVDELGIEPGPELRAVERAVLDHDTSLLLGNAPVRVRTPLDVPSWLRPPRVLIGRSAPLRELGDAWARASAGERLLVVVEGEPGIGKTALVSQFANERAAGGDVVLAGRCSPDRPLTYEPLANMFEPLLDAQPELVRELGEDSRGLAPILPYRTEIAGRLLDAPTESEAARVLLARATTALPRLAAPGAPAVVVVIDDVHWATPQLLGVLDEWVRADETQGMLLLTSSRVVEGALVTDLAARLARDRKCLTITLDGLDAADLQTLIGTRHTHAVVDGGWLHAASGGNPFYAEELLDHLEHTGGGRAGAVPRTLRDAIESRLALLSEACVEMLGAAAVVGPSFSLGVAASMQQLDPVAAERLLAEARRARLVRPGSGEQFEFVHAVVRDVVLAEIGPLTQATYHRRAARIGSTADRHEDRLVARARHLIAGADDTSRLSAVGAARVAAAHAISRGAYDDALALLTDAAGLVEHDGHAAARVELLCELCEAASLAGDVGLSRRSGYEACDLSIALADYDAAARALWLLAFPIGDPDSWQPRAALVTAHLPESSPLRSLLDAYMIEYWVRTDPAGAQAIGQAIDDRMRAGVDDPRIAAAALNSLRVLMWIDSPETNLDRMERALVAAREAQDWRILLATVMALRLEHLVNGDVERSDAVGREYEELAEQSGLQRSHARVLQHRAMRALMAGDFATAEALGEQAIATHQDTEFIEGYALQLFAIRLEQGRLDEIAGFVDEWAAQRDMWPGLQVGRALVMVETGRRAEAEAILVDVSTDAFRAIPRDEALLMGLGAAAHVAIACEHKGIAVELVDLLEPYADRMILAPSGAICWGSVARFCAPLNALLGRTRRAAEHYERAIAMHERSRAEPFLARDLLGYARLLDGERAAEVRARGVALAARLSLEPLLRS